MAKRNYRYFYLFLVSVFSMCLYAMGCNVAVIVLGKSTPGVSSPKYIGHCSKEYWLMTFYALCNYAASQQMGFGNALKNYPASVIEFIICGLGAIAVSGLACMHTWLIATGQTTNEDVSAPVAFYSLVHLLDCVCVHQNLMTQAIECNFSNSLGSS